MKFSITKTRLGLIAGLLSLSLLLTTSVAQAQTKIEITAANLPSGFFSNPNKLITDLVNIAFIIAIILVFFYLIWGGIEWITSGGEKGKTESARNKITAAVIGLIVLAAAFAVLTLTLQLLGYASLDEALRFSNDQLKDTSYTAVPKGY
jgi:hypothetical protein